METQDLALFYLWLECEELCSAVKIILVPLTCDVKAPHFFWRQGNNYIFERPSFCIIFLVCLTKVAHFPVLIIFLNIKCGLF